MKKIIFIFALSFTCVVLYGQNYPAPEFSNEVYFLNRNDSNKLIRLEKTTSKGEASSGVFKGAEQSYSIDGSQSTVRIPFSRNISFVYSTGSSENSQSSSDSAMSANGIDPNMLSQMMGQGNPSQNITLYKVDKVAGGRKIYIYKSPGAFSFGKKKDGSSAKCSFSTKKIKEGYLEFVPDKPLSKGEYAFIIPQFGMGVGGGEVTVLSFGID